MIYFIQCGEDGPVKIGRARNPESRLSELQTGFPERLYLRAALDVEDEIETNLHKTLDNCRLRGEWFDSKEIIVNIAMACAMAGHVWDYVCEACASNKEMKDERRDDRESRTETATGGLGADQSDRGVVGVAGEG